MESEVDGFPKSVALGRHESGELGLAGLVRTMERPRSEA